ncbi:hypothetical protein [Singulisphaera sp. PoT]|uniref:hypothetical protein n=1 Tax=Singulisphaera sp. PoT TaxID=3411797 RepID=UPI003BF5366C
MGNGWRLPLFLLLITGPTLEVEAREPIPLAEGADISATSNKFSYSLEFRLPWANFPNFKPVEGAVLAIDAKLCNWDGKNLVDRTFAYRLPLLVQQPASLGKVKLVKSLDPDDMAAIGVATFPLWVEISWKKAERSRAQAIVAIPPEIFEIVGRVEIRFHDTDGKIVTTLEAPLERFGLESLGFERAVARWSVDDFAPRRFFVTAGVISRTDRTLVTAAPRMVQEAIVSGRQRAG